MVFIMNFKGYEFVFAVSNSKRHLVVLLLCFVCSCYTWNNEDVSGGEPLPWHGTNRNQQLRMSCMMLTYVKSKGCDYVMAFVKGHYYAHSRDSDDHHRDAAPKACDWRPWVEKKCMEYHVPPELCCALMDCGASQSMTALGTPATVLENCNMTYALSVGKRSSRLCDPHQSINFMCQSASVFGKRNVIMDQSDAFHAINISKLTENNFHSLQINVTSMTNSTAKPTTSLSSHHTVLSTPSVKRPDVRRWCKFFSRHVNKRYRLNEVKFVRQSIYWLVDIYKAARHHGVPKSYTHGLVGCGIDYAMFAFNVKKWQTVLYGLTSK